MNKHHNITAAQKKQYRTIGHNLKPVVTVAEKGISENLMAELDRALEDHELIKIKLAISDREIRRKTAETVCEQVGAVIVQEIGKILLILRRAQKANLKKSNLG